jgi:alpha-soluble NSF attachment protein
MSELPHTLPQPLPAGIYRHVPCYLLLTALSTCATDKEAGQAFEKAASVQTQNLNEPDDAANTLQEAFKVYRKSDPEDAARVLTSAINHYVLRGNLRRAATQQQYLAELYEVELGDMKKALEAYEKAADWFEGDNAEAYASTPP